MIDLEAVSFLLCPEGDRLLNQAKLLKGSFLSKITTLRKEYPSKIVTAALELTNLRKLAVKKFSRADDMFFTREALEQSSGEVISHYRAERFIKDNTILDLCCRIGGDTIALAGRGYVTAVDIDPVRLAMAKRNLEVYGLSDRVKFICDDVTKIPFYADAAFLDPSRRSFGRRVTRLTDINPPLEFIHRLKKEIKNCAVKLSPMTDDEELEELEGEVEFISDSGECKEALVWFGDFKTASKRATILPEGVSLIEESPLFIRLLPPGSFIYEPDPCIIRAHFIEQLAVKIDAWRINENIAYLSSNKLMITPYADAYKVIDSLPFNIKALKKQLHNLEAGRVIIKKRGIPFEPDEIEKRLRVEGNRELVLILTSIMDKIWAFICEPVKEVEV